MTGGTKVINRSLTIISLMVMIAAGSLIITIPEASADDYSIVFYINPVDEQMNTLLNCEAKISPVDDEENYVYFQSDNEGIITIDSQYFTWEFGETSCIDVEVSDNTGCYAFALKEVPLGSGMLYNMIDTCGINVYSLASDDRYYTSSGGPRDNVYISKWDGMPTTISYVGEQGMLYFQNTYYAHLTADHFRGFDGADGQKARMTISKFYFEVYKGLYYGDDVYTWGGQPEYSRSRTYPKVIELDNTNNDADDAHWDPTFEITFTRTLMPSTHSYKFVMGATWTIEVYSTAQQQWISWDLGSWDESTSHICKGAIF